MSKNNKRRKKVKAKMARQKAHQQMLLSHMSKKYNDQIGAYIKAQLEAQKEQIENTEDGVVEVIEENINEEE